MPNCENCKFMYADNRVMKYRREPMFFCRLKGSLHSRNHKVGQGTRIDKNSPACNKYIENTAEQTPASKIYVE